MSCALWVKYRDLGDREVMRLILEVMRARRVITSANTDACALYSALSRNKEEDMKAALQRLMRRLSDEGVRLGAVGGKVVQLATDVQYRRVK
jgi:hypothetical protein